MKKINSLKKITNSIAVIVLLFSVIPFVAAVNVTSVFADGEEITDPEEAPPTEAIQVEQPSEAPVDEAPVEEPVADTVVEETEEPVVEDILTEEPVVEEILPEEAPVADAASAEPETDLTEVIAALNENDVLVVDETGEPLSMASAAAEEILSSTDPFFWNGIEWVGYTIDGTGCPANVTCFASASPFQDAVTNAGIGNTIYVASGNYNEDVVVNTANLSFVAFHAITVPDASANVVTLDSSGYAVVKSLTLNVNFGSTDGVYADLVTVNEPGKTGGRLDDAMSLSNDGGRIEADVVIYSADGYYRVKDKNDPTINFEWECGEPNEVSYPNRTYRMTLMNPFDVDILAYYEAHGDERSALVGPNYLDLSAAERMEDLLIAVNVSEDYGFWTHGNEKLIYWNLVGNIGTDNNGANITLNATQQDMADDITSGNRDDVTRYWGIWFMYPTTENGSAVSPANRQLTFLVHDPRPVYGCMDPIAENYNPMADTVGEVDMCVYREGCMDPDALNYDAEAVREDDSCRYPNTIVTPPTNFGPLPIPVTGNEEFLIPVTGIDANQISGYGLMQALILLGVISLGTGMIFLNVKKLQEQIQII